MRPNSLHDWLDLINESKAVILLVILVCGLHQTNVHDCDYFIEGMCFKTRYKIDQSDVKMVVDMVEGELLNKYSHVPRLKKMLADHNVVVVVDGGDLMTQCVPDIGGVPGIYSCDKNIEGANAEGNTIIIENKKCIGYSALAHEILHSFERYGLGITPPKNHSTRGLFKESHKKDLTPSVEILVDWFYAYTNRDRDCLGE